MRSTYRKLLLVVIAICFVAIAAMVFVALTAPHDPRVIPLGGDRTGQLGDDARPFG